MSLHKLQRSFPAVFLALLTAAPALAQYPGGSGGSGSGVYTAPKGGYGSSTGIVIGAGAAAAVGVTYLALRGRGTVTGCVEQSGAGNRLRDEKNQNTYALVASSVALSPGERVALRGKKSKDDSGQATFQATKLVKDYGSCKQ